jgi:enterochelin esterase-like enzyme
MSDKTKWAGLAIGVLLVVGLPSCATPEKTAETAAPQTVTGQTAKGGVLERIKVHGASLAGNLEGNPADRDVIVYLPPSYASNPRKRYPVIYNLHGYSVGANSWSRFLQWPAPIDKAIASGGSREMIVVMPDAQTLHNGSMYSNSVTTGDWEAYVARDLIIYIDSHYRTLAKRESRGLAGHSMGGYGTLRIGMKHPEVFSSIYAMSSCCLPPRTPPSGDSAKAIEAVKTKEEAIAGGMGIRSTLSVAAAWSPNPNNPPFYVDLPTKDGVVQPSVIARWHANAPLAMVHQYVPAMRSFTAIGLEVGTADGGLKDTTAMHEVLNGYGIKHVFETYDGNHTNRIVERFETKLMPFFSNNLVFQ